MGTSATAVFREPAMFVERFHHEETEQERHIRCTILIVDDENGPRQALRILLKEDHEVLLAENVAAAREILNDQRIDLIITDLRMPKESGIALLEWVKEHHPDVEVIILTGYGQLETAMKAVEWGAFAYLEKPFDNNAMFKHVQKALSKRMRELERRQFEQLALEANRFETLGRFVSGMLHDLSTPLSVIGSYIELIQADSRMEREAMDKKLDVMQSQTKHCSDVVRSAMNFLRHQSSEMIDLNLNEVAKSCISVSWPVVTKQGVKLESTLPEDLPRVKGDFVLVRQAVLNLITNAVQAMESQDDSKAIEVETWTEGNHAYLSVSDTGPGIAADHEQKVFSTFFTTKGDGGTGLGLAAVSHIMKRHNGEVYLGDSKDSGAQFVLKFPMDSNQE